MTEFCTGLPFEPLHESGFFLLTDCCWRSYGWLQSGSDTNTVADTESVGV